MSSLDAISVAGLVERVQAAFNGHDPDALAALCTEDVRWFDPGLPEPVDGRDGVRYFAEATFRSFPDFEVEDTGGPYLADSSDVVLAEYRFTGTMLGPWEPRDFAATGARVSVDGVDRYELRGELIARYDTFYDSLDMARQLGIMPPTGSGAERALARLQHVQARFQRRGSSPPR